MCSNFTYTLSLDELVDHLRRQRHMEPVDEGFGRRDAPGARLRMQQRLRVLYLGALCQLPIELLPLTDRTADVMVNPDPADPTAATLRLPSDTLRLAAIRLGGWHRDATIVAPGSPEAAAQDSPLARAGVYAPVAVALPGGLLRLYPADATVASLLCVVAPAGDSFLLTPQLEQHILDHYD